MAALITDSPQTEISDLDFLYFYFALAAATGNLSSAHLLIIASQNNNNMAPTLPTLPTLLKLLRLLSNPTDLAGWPENIHTADSYRFYSWHLKFRFNLIFLSVA